MSLANSVGYQLLVISLHT